MGGRWSRMSRVLIGFEGVQCVGMSKGVNCVVLIICI